MRYIVRIIILGMSLMLLVCAHTVSLDIILQSEKENKLEALIRLNSDYIVKNIKLHITF